MADTVVKELLFFFFFLKQYKRQFVNTILFLYYLFHR